MDIQATSTWELVNEHSLVDGSSLPLVIAPLEPTDLNSWAENNRAELDRRLLKHGAILFRGFGINTVEKLRGFSSVFSPNLIEYTERHSPRTDLGDKVYSSTVHPADQVIHFHNTTSFSHQWPQRIWFNCIQPAEEGGMTPLADCRRVLARLSDRTRAKFLALGVCYVRNFYSGIGLSWQSTFQTTEKTGVETFCRDYGIEFEWIGDRLRTRQVRHAVVRHPKTAELCWFNQAFHFHVTSLPSKISQILCDIYPEEDLPRNSYYGDGSPIEQEVLTEIFEAYEQERVLFPWQKGDVVMIDNMLVAHARTTYKGDRLIALTLADRYQPTYTGGGIT